MREIKFRAWDSTNGKWMDLGRPSVCMNPLNGQLESVDDLSTSYWDWNEYKLMQYTGLKDCNGREISLSSVPYNPCIIISTRR